jgi:hypothetical protein
VVYGKLGGNESRPRDLKQCQNFKYAINSNKRISRDEYHAVHVLDAEHKFFRWAKTIPNVRLIVADLGLVEQFKLLTKFSKR